MDKINLKDILDGKLIKLPYKLDINEHYAFTRSLADALAARQKDFPGIGELVTPETVDSVLDWEGWSAITDNFILFMMNEDNEFSTEIIVAAFIRAIRTHQIPFDSDSAAFNDLFDKLSPWLYSDSPSATVYVGDGKHVDVDDWAPTPAKENFGGHFTLRDHNK